MGRFHQSPMNDYHEMPLDYVWNAKDKDVPSFEVPYSPPLGSQEVYKV